MPPELDTIAGRYVLESEISKGGMATVWLARDNVLARPVAVKILHPHLSRKESNRQRFAHAGHTIQKLRDAIGQVIVGKRSGKPGEFLNTPDNPGRVP